MKRNVCKQHRDDISRARATHNIRIKFYLFKPDFVIEERIIGTKLTEMSIE